MRDEPVFLSNTGSACIRATHSVRRNMERETRLEPSANGARSLHKVPSCLFPQFLTVADQRRFRRCAGKWYLARISGARYSRRMRYNGASKGMRLPNHETAERICAL